MENQKALPDLITFLYLLKTLKKTEIRSSFFPFLVAFDPSQNRRHRIRTTQIPTKKEQITKLREPTLQRSIRFHSSTNLHCCQKTSKWTERNSSRKASLLPPCLCLQDEPGHAVWATPKAIFFFFYAHFKMAATYRCRLVTSIQTPISTGIY